LIIEKRLAAEIDDGGASLSPICVTVTVKETAVGCE
jgi:hypothetical protein